MDFNFLWRSKRKQASIVKRPQIDYLAIEVVRYHKEIKMKSTLISTTTKLDSPEMQILSKHSLKEDIKMLLKESAKLTKRLTLAKENIKSNSMKIYDPMEIRFLENEFNNQNVWFVTMRDVESWD